MLDLVILFLEVSLLFCDNKTTCSVNLRKWYLFHQYVLVIFKIVMLSVSLKQSFTVYKPLEFRLLCQKVTL